ncbi:MerR family transcriptional regulator [Methyloversatilis thermotolerans]|uniref:MerR family transcriptional regulator n=1 Tax=Methyloversatilis thermotolerans TaxID=1346290 RepID=UPI000382E20D|nr:MerR family transcriptional regulator [Methyloversatilis thermotolerans]
MSVTGLGLLNISAVERETGLAKDTLRVWERRYGFPKPARDEAGERLYTQEDVNRLRLIRRLIDQGWRPGKLLSASHSELQAIVDAERSARVPALLSGETLEAIRRHDVDGLRAVFQRTLLDQGLQGLVTGLIAPLNVDIGEAWMRGELGVPDEHFYTEQVQNFLRGALSSYPRPVRSPRVLLTTLPEEEHALGLIMAEVMLLTEGVQCCSLGPRMPLADIRTSAATVGADIVALSFSAAFPVRQAIAGVRTLRQLLPESVAIWVGGAGARDKLRSETGIQIIRSIDDVVPAVAAWRVANGAAT